MAHFNLIRGSPSPQVPSGKQNDGVQVYLAVAHTPHGDIPCKASGTTAWYPYGGSENATNNFSFVAVPGSTLVGNSPNNPPPNAIICGHQNDGAGPLYAVITHSQHGNIPGKGKPGNAWYTYDGKEHVANNFSWVVANQIHAWNSHPSMQFFPDHYPLPLLFSPSHCIDVGVLDRFHFHTPLELFLIFFCRTSTTTCTQHPSSSSWRSVWTSDGWFWGTPSSTCSYPSW
eukprot:TRINITY_DN5_c0_g1_i7.p1 TRINITY_DN5_c0_g1~~TRINITY_DN5_c0_g1_i7.p1  ORF type:complete len:252 (+),score=25.48 TRINITY_DN5_c0_g1_i7:70-756(+)